MLIFIITSKRSPFVLKTMLEKKVGQLESVQILTSLLYVFQDGGPNNDGLNTSTTLNILIKDADDLPAVFSPSSYTAEVQENAAKVNCLVTQYLIIFSLRKSCMGKEVIRMEK